MWKALNGKKKIIIPTVALVPIALFLLSMQVGYNGRVIANEVKIEVCEEAMDSLKEMPIQIARLEQNNSNIEGNLSRVQKNVEIMQADIKLILKAVK